METITIPMVDDFHLHLRQGDMAKQVAPMVAEGGVDRCVVMPNTTPMITTTEQAMAYRSELQSVAPETELLMTLYLHSDLTVDEIEKAAKNAVFGVKCYPRGVTTNSASGVEDLSAYAHIFEAMQKIGLPLLIHGEVPSNSSLDICIMNAEEKFLPELERLHSKFPGLRIVLEHATTRAAIECVKGLGENVAATITLHHLELTIDDWVVNPHNYCKPVAKYPHDRDAIRAIVSSGHPRFFFGSDSAPHPQDTKEKIPSRAGVFTTPILLPALADCFDRLGCLDKLKDFTSTFGAQFHRLPPTDKTLTLAREEWIVPKIYGQVVPLFAGKKLNWKIVEKS